MKLSIIIPVYNVEQYLRKCVESLIHQDYSSYELILVDDGSTDSSPDICDEYVKREYSEEIRVNSIKVIHQANAGLSAARNVGLKVAKGEYVCFVDSDDYWEENVLGELMEQVERENLDVLRFDYQNVKLKHEGIRGLESEREYEIFEPNKTPRYIDKGTEVVDGLTYLNTRMGFACYAVMFIIKRSLLVKELENEGIRELEGDCLFTKGIHFEDVEWLPRMMQRAKRVNSVQTIVYNYLVRQGSITKTQGDKTKILKNLEDCLLIIDRYRHYKEQNPECTWLYNMQSSIVAGVLKIVAREFYAERKDYIERLKDMKVFPLRIADQGETYKRRARLINVLGPRVYCAIMNIMQR